MALRTGRRQRAVDGAKIDAEMGEEKPEVVLPEKEVQVVLDEHARDEHQAAQRRGARPPVEAPRNTRQNTQHGAPKIMTTASAPRKPIWST